MKQITITGRNTKDAELASLSDGTTKVATWGVAVNDRSDEATFFDCSLFGKRAEALAQYIRKGEFISVAGDFSTREHNGKTYLKINVREVTLCGGKAEKNDVIGRDGRTQTAGPVDHDDEIPF